MSTMSRVVVAICFAPFTVQFSNPVFVKQLAAAEIGSITNDRNTEPNQKKKSTPKENTGPRYAVQVPEPTVRDIPYGDHSRQILDFGVLLNLTRHHLYLLSTVVDGKADQRRGLIDLSTSTVC